MPKVSVIVPVYNCEKYIDKCARSLFEQTLDDIEYIFVNDCTPDNSMLILENIIKEYPYRTNSIKILNHTINTGQSGARRDGMAIATGDYIIHCDSDDWVDVTMYEEMYNIAVANDVDAVCCDMLMEFTSGSERLHYNSEYNDHQLMYDCIAPITVVYMSMCNRLVSRKIFEHHEIIPFEGVNMWDDVGLAVRIRYYIQSTSVVNKPFYHYNRINETSTTCRPVIGRIKEQIECVRYLEDFFIAHNSFGRYEKFLAYLKILSKVDMFTNDYIKDWLNCFSESNDYIFRLPILKVHFGKRFVFLMWLVAKLGICGWFLIDNARVIKKAIKRIFDSLLLLFYCIYG